MHSKWILKSIGSSLIQGTGLFCGETADSILNRTEESQQQTQTLRRAAGPILSSVRFSMDNASLYARKCDSRCDSECVNQPAQCQCEGVATKLRKNVNS